MKTFLITLFLRQNKWHRHGVFIHTLKVCYYTIYTKEYKLFTSALFHDIGKPFVAYQDINDKLTGEFSFTDHEEKSYQLINKCRLISDYTKNIVRYHYLIRDIRNSFKRKNINRYHNKLKIWKSLSLQTKRDLKKFLKLDDLGKI